jgi:hypothetical protein
VSYSTPPDQPHVSRRRPADLQVAGDAPFPAQCPRHEISPPSTTTDPKGRGDGGLNAGIDGAAAGVAAVVVGGQPGRTSCHGLLGDDVARLSRRPSRKRTTSKPDEAKPVERTSPLKPPEADGPSRSSWRAKPIRAAPRHQRRTRWVTPRLDGSQLSLHRATKQSDRRVQPDSTRLVFEHGGRSGVTSTRALVDNLVLPMAIILRQSYQVCGQCHFQR